jgi:UDP-glucuronate 4-epimerase
MKILVTGAAGFIGFHLISKLVNKNIEIIGIDNINDYYDVNLKLGRLKECGIQNFINEEVPIRSKKHSNYTFIKCDIGNRDTVKKLFFDYEFDIVCNFAAQAGVRYSIENPNAYIDSNIVGFTNILEGCRHSNVKHLVYASSSSVYGLNKKIPFSPSDNVDHPISLYAATKKSNELMAHTYSHLYGVPTTGLRFFTVYGPWGRPDMAYFLFTDLILNGKPIKIFNNGKMKRDFTYIEDIVKGVLKVIENPPKKNEDESSLTSAPYKIYNIGNNSPVSLLDFINILEEKLGKKADKIYMPMQPGDVYETFADVSDLIKDLGYKPETKLEEGIGAFINWYVEYYKIYNLT